MWAAKAEQQLSILFGGGAIIHQLDTSQLLKGKNDACGMTTITNRPLLSLNLIISSTGKDDSTQ